MRQSTLAAKVSGSKQGKKTFAVTYVPYSKDIEKKFLCSTLFTLQIMYSLLFYSSEQLLTASGAIWRIFVRIAFTIYLN
jgi:hypothetical protein